MSVLFIKNKMVERSIRVNVKPDVFKWLRVSAGWSIEEVSKRIRTTSKIVKAFERGEKKPTLRQLRELSHAFKRPIAAFFLPEPRKEKPNPKDYRFIPNKTNIFDKKTILVLRRARYLQEIGKELSKNIGYETKAKIKKVTLSDNPEMIAKKYRDLFELNEEKQREFNTAYDFLNHLIDILENINILVFQFSMPLEDARGFVLLDDSPFVIVINAKDSVEVRLFSLMDEFAHILLGESAINFPDISTHHENKIERWCNEFASSVILPKDDARIIFEKNITEFKKKGEKTGSGIPADKKCISEIGIRFISIVANNYELGYITYADALDYLSIKSKHFDKVLEKAVK